MGHRCADTPGRMHHALPCGVTRRRALHAALHGPARPCMAMSYGMGRWAQRIQAAEPTELFLPRPSFFTSQSTVRTTKQIWKASGLPGFYRGYGTVIFGTIPARLVRHTTGAGQPASKGDAPPTSPA